jgi:gamma-glutamyltranspeptidase/glutathione hydrolase
MIGFTKEILHKSLYVGCKEQGGLITMDDLAKMETNRRRAATPDSIKNELKKMGYKISFANRISGPINAIYFDWLHGSL